MKKEKFLYEIIDNYLYIVNLGCIVLENYFLVDRTKDFTNCANCLEDCLDFYDQLYSRLDNNEYSPSEVDAILNHIVLILKEKTLQDLIIQLQSISRNQIPYDKDFVKKYLLLDENGRPKELTAEALLAFMGHLREAEAAYTVKRVFR